tara:strand:- start:7310 stop:7579 length:270 start_codon:yes stop_codon:yes gene_type:complete
MKNLKTLLLAIILVFTFNTMNAQEPTYKIVGNEIVKTSTKSAKADPIKTELTYTIKGVVYPVYQGSKGGYFIKRVSKKSGKEYKQYLKV